MELLESVGVLLGLYVSYKVIADFLGGPIRSSIKQHDRAVAEAFTPRRGLLRMWCDDCKHMVARPNGTYGDKDTGHRNGRCAGVNMWEMPPAAEISSAAEAKDTVVVLAEAGDRELNDWLMEHAGTTQLSKDELDLFREQLNLTRKIVD